MESISVTVIVVSYNGLFRNWLKNCIDSLVDSNFKVQIIVVDNNSKDESVTFVKRSYPDVILIESPINLGFGGANNLGIEKALKLGAKYVFLLNQDASVKKDTIGELVRVAESNKEFGVISPIHLNGKGDGLDYNFSLQISPQNCKGLFSDLFVQKLSSKVYESTFVCAAAWLVSKNTLKIVGGFNPSFFHYGEDDNFCQRVRYFNLKVGVLPTVSIYHDREERPLNKFQAESVKLKRAYLRKLSNPFLNEKPEGIKAWFKHKYYKISNNTDLAELHEYQLDLLKSNKLDEIKKNYEISKSEMSFKFLNYID